MTPAKQISSILFSLLLTSCGAAPPPIGAAAPGALAAETTPADARPDAGRTAPPSDAPGKPAAPAAATPPAMPLLNMVTFAAVVAYPDPPSPAPARAQTAPTTASPLPDLTGERKRVARKISASKLKLGKSRGDKRFAAMRELAEHHADMAALAANEKAEQRGLNEALALYVKCLDPAFAQLPGYDEARFGHAFTLQRLGDYKGALVAFRELIKHHPTSPRIPDVYLAFADYYFNSGSVDTAAQFYAKVLAFPKSPLAAYAGYKLAWCYINLAEHQRALEQLYKVVVEARRSPTKQAAALAHSATNDMVYVYSHVGKPDKAAAFFARVDPSAAADMLERLGETYSMQGKYAEAIVSRRLQMKSGPHSPRLCAWQIDVVDATGALGAPARTARELTRLAQIRDQLLPSGGAPASPEAKVCDRAVRTRIGSHARSWHREARATRDLATAELAIASYELYLDRFTTSPEAALNQRYVAELLWQKAAATTNATAALPLWQRAATAFADIATSTRASTATRDQTILAAVVGFDNALIVAATLGRDAAELRQRAHVFCDWLAAHHPERAAAADVQALRAHL